MKGLLIILLLVGVVVCLPWHFKDKSGDDIGVAFAADPCESYKSAFRICTNASESNFLVTWRKCEDVQRDDYSRRYPYGTLEKARMERDLRNASNYSGCVADQENNVWKEIK